MEAWANSRHKFLSRPDNLQRTTESKRLSCSGLIKPARGASAERSLIDREEVREEIAAHVQESHSEQDGGEHREPGKHDIRVYDGYRYSELQFDIKHPQKRWANLICAENERRKGYTMAEWFHWCKDKRNFVAVSRMDAQSSSYLNPKSM